MQQRRRPCLLFKPVETKILVWRENNAGSVTMGLGGAADPG
jgi:hypothetical protein